MAVTDMFRLDDRVAIVTGASSGLGVAFAQGLAEAGADVVLGARRADRLEDTAELVRGAGRRALPVTTDVADPDSCTALVEAAMAEFGRVDVLVNNAGVGTAAPATRETPEQFRSVIDVNLNGCYWMAQACGRVMKPGSSIINISSVLGLTTAGLPQAAYASSKAGLIGMTRDLALQWTGRKGIRVNAIAPGFFASEMTEQYPDGYLESQESRIPAGRKGDPAELAATVVFLASDAAGYVTGQTLPVVRRHDDHLMAPPYVLISGAGEPRDPALLETATTAGRMIAERGWIALTGGLGGVMAAAAAGVDGAGGTAVAILPGVNRADASPGHAVVLPTGMGEMRNALLVRSADAVLAIGGAWGTLSEVALAARTGVPVVTIGTDLPAFAGPEVQAVESAEAAIEVLAGILPG
jgi:uncharacterized protein (TIGR00725 family)